MTKDSDRTLKVGVVGVGAMGRHHVRNYSLMLRAELIGIVDVDKFIGRSVAEEYNTKYYPHIDALLDAGVEAVSIAVPTSKHLDVAKKAMEKGVHVLVEKPIADTIKNAKKLIDLAEKNDVKLMVGHIERFNPVIPIMKNAIKKKRIISLDFVRVGPFPPRIYDVGVIIDLAVHDIDLARFLTGSEVVDMHSATYSSDGRREDTALIHLTMENGTLASINVNWLTPFKIREIMMTTPELVLKGWLVDQRVASYSKFKEDGSYIVKEYSIPYAEPLNTELKAFLDSIRNDKVPAISGDDGLKSLDIAMRCLSHGNCVTL